MGDGLGGAFAVQNNPTVVVRGQVFHIVNDDAYNLSSTSDNLMDGMLQTFPGTTGTASSLNLNDVTVYSGSTTGRSYNNVDSCLLYQITWQVDQKCRLISAKSFDAMCKKMKYDYGMSADTHPHQSAISCPTCSLRTLKPRCRRTKRRRPDLAGRWTNLPAQRYYSIHRSQEATRFFFNILPT